MVIVGGYMKDIYGDELENGVSCTQVTCVHL